jgi:hypothetical protein
MFIVKHSRAFICAFALLATLMTAGHSFAVTLQTFDGGGTAFGTHGNASVVAGVTGQTGQLTPAAGSQNGRISFADTSSGALYTTTTASFDFRAQPGNGQADGLSLILLPTDVHGTGTGNFLTTGAAEFAQVPGALGVGFNIHQGGPDISNNSIYVTANGNIVTQVAAPFDMSTTDFHNAQVTVNYGVGGNATLDLALTQDINGAATTTQVITGLDVKQLSIPYNHRVGFIGRTGGQNALQQVDNINVVNSGEVASTSIVHDFDSAPGTGFSTHGSASIQGGVTGDFGRLTLAANGQFGRLAFDATGTTDGYESVTGRFDFRANGGADGLSLVLIPTTGADGQGNSGDFALAGAAEFGRVAGGIGIGFNIHNGGANAGDISNNSIYVAFDGATVAQIQAPFDISTAAFHRALFDLEFVAGGALLDLSLVEDVNGAPGSLQSIFDDLFIAGAVPYDFRAGFAGRTGGLNADQGIDNVFIEVTSIPEPASAFLLTVGLAGLVARRRRRCAA